MKRDLLFGLCLALLCMTASAETRDRQVEIGIKTGVSAFFFGQSNALPHRIKPNLRLALTSRASSDLNLGLELVTVPDPNENYRLIGGLLTLGLPVYRGEVFRLNAAAGWGLGTGPRILHADLDRSEAITLWGMMGLQFRWSAMTDVLDLGIDLLSENISMATVSLVIGYRI